MLSSLALAAVLVLPVVGALVLRLAHAIALRRAPQLLARFGLVSGLLAALTVAGAWVWSQSGAQTVVGDWSAISFMAVPLAISPASGTMAVVIAYAVVRLSAALDPARGDPTPSVSSALMFAGLVLAMTGTTLPTLLLGIGAMDTAAVWLATRREGGQRAMQSYLTQCVGLLLAGLAYALTSANAQSFRLSGAPALSDGSPLIAAILGAAACLHANCFPFDVGRQTRQTDQLHVGMLGALAILQHAQMVPGWTIALAVFSALIWSLRALKFGNRARQASCVSHAAGYLALVSAVAGVPAAGAAGWLLGSELLGTVTLTRLIGCLGLVGIPLLAGFTGLAGAATALAARGVDGLAVTALLAGAQAVFVFAVLRYLLRFGSLVDLIAATRQSLTQRGELLPLLPVVAHLVLFGVLPALSGRAPLPALFAQHGAVGWLTLLFALAVGALLWRAARNLRDNTVDRLIAISDGLSALGKPVFSALDRLSVLLGTVFTIFESDGALLWGFLITLVALLISQPGSAP